VEGIISRTRRSIILINDFDHSLVGIDSFLKDDFYDEKDLKTLSTL